MSSYQLAALKSALIVLLLGITSLLNLGRFDWAIAIVTLIVALHVAVRQIRHAQFI